MHTSAFDACCGVGDECRVDVLFDNTHNGLNTDSLVNRRCLNNSGLEAIFYVQFSEFAPVEMECAVRQFLAQSFKITISMLAMVFSLMFVFKVANKVVETFAQIVPINNLGKEIIEGECYIGPTFCFVGDFIIHKWYVNNLFHYGEPSGLPRFFRFPDFRLLLPRRVSLADNRIDVRDIAQGLTIMIIVVREHHFSSLM